MDASDQVCYTTASAPEVSDFRDEYQLIKCIEEGNTEVKIHALKQIIHSILKGEKFPRILMPIIRFVLPLQAHAIKKLLQIFWEIVPKTDADGKLLDEMILVCEYFRKDLLHPNKYVRGSTLRLLCRLKEPELLEPLISPIRKCLECHHAYVRRNAIFAVFTIYKNFDYLIPDALKIITELLQTETDESCKRNAFIMLTHINQGSAQNYLCSCIDEVSTFDSSLQLIILEFICKICCVNQVKETPFIHCVYKLLNSGNAAVRYEAAGALVALSNTPTAIRAAASCYIELIVNGNDNNVKLIVLDCLIALKQKYSSMRVMDDIAMAILQVLTAPDLEVQQKIISLVQDLVSPRNVGDIVLVFKKEIIKTCSVRNCEDNIKYRQLLISGLRSCCIKFPGPENSAVPELLEFLPDFDEETAIDILAFVQEAIQRSEHLWSPTISKLLEVFSSIMSSKVHCSVLWILGEYCCTVEYIHIAMMKFCQCIGNIPIVDELKQSKNSDKKAPDTVIAPAPKLVVADGTYAAESTYDSNKLKTPVRDYLMNGDYFAAAALSSTLVKLALKYVRLVADPKKQNSFIAKSMLIMASVMHLGKSGLTLKDMNDDDLERISLCLKVLANHCPRMVEIFDVECRKSFAAMLTANEVDEPKNQKVRQKEKFCQIDAPITFGQLNSSIASETREMSLNEVKNFMEKMSETCTASMKLNKVFQLTGFSDPVYIEAYVYLNVDNILLDILIVNQTCDTLVDCNLELVASGSLKLFESPPSFILAPSDFCSVKASVKASCSKNGIVFGNMTYKENTSTTERCIVLNGLHIDVMKISMVPTSCGEQNFPKMWRELAWENKVIVNTHFQDLNECVKFVAHAMNTKCLTPEKMLPSECGFLSANLYGCSTFGECVAANVCIEKNPLIPDSPVIGHVRVRTNCKDLALSLSEKLKSLSQKNIKMGTGG